MIIFIYETVWQTNRPNKFNSRCSFVERIFAKDVRRLSSNWYINVMPIPFLTDGHTNISNFRMDSVFKMWKVNNVRQWR